MKTIGIIQARMGASRLYGKILYPLKKKPLLHVLMKRLEQAEVDQWWLATTTEKEDNLTTIWGEALGLHVYRGSVNDVLSRFTSIIRIQHPDYVVRITADDPFTDGCIVNMMLHQTYSMPAEKKILATGPNRVLPLGLAPSVVVAESLLDAESQIPEDQKYHKTHVTSWLTKHHMLKEFVPPKEWPERPYWRWTVDTIDDFLMTSAAFDLFDDQWETIDYPEMVARLDQRPDITNLNKHISQKKIEEG